MKLSVLALLAISAQTLVSAEEVDPTKVQVFTLLEEASTSTGGDGRRLLQDEAVFYTGELELDTCLTGTATAMAYGNTRAHLYYTFTPPAGPYNLKVHRKTSAMDPALYLCKGLLTSYPRWPTDCPGGEFVVWADDNGGIPHGVGGWYGDPTADFEADGSTYTLAVFDYIGQGGAEYTFEVHVNNEFATCAPYSPVALPTQYCLHDACPLVERSELTAEQTNAFNQRRRGRNGGPNRHGTPMLDVRLNPPMAPGETFPEPGATLYLTCADCTVGKTVFLWYLDNTNTPTKRWSTLTLLSA